nr:MAG TPA: SUMO-conjugating enzyme UBC9 [Caudoviricetes sp.]
MWGGKTMKNTTNHTHRLKLPPNFYPIFALNPY